MQFVLLGEVAICYLFGVSDSSPLFSCASFWHILAEVADSLQQRYKPSDVMTYSLKSSREVNVCVFPFDLMKAIKSFLGVKSSPTSTSKALDSFSSVSREGFILPVASPLIDGWVTPMRSARVFNVMPCSLQISLILSCNIYIKYWFVLQRYKNNVLQHKFCKKIL